MSQWKVINGFNLVRPDGSDERHEIGETVELSQLDADSLLYLNAIEATTPPASDATPAEVAPSEPSTESGTTPPSEGTA